MKFKKVFVLIIFSLILIMTLSSRDPNGAFTEGQNASATEGQNSSAVG